MGAVARRTGGGRREMVWVIVWPPVVVVWIGVEVRGVGVWEVMVSKRMVVIEESGGGGWLC